MLLNDEALLVAPPQGAEKPPVVLKFHILTSYDIYIVLTEGRADWIPFDLSFLRHWVFIEDVLDEVLLVLDRDNVLILEPFINLTLAGALNT